MLFDSHSLIDHDHDHHEDPNQAEEYENELAVKNLISGRTRMASIIAPNTETKRIRSASVLAVNRFAEGFIGEKKNDQLLINVDEHKNEHSHDHDTTDKRGNLTAYILLIALSIHSIFEGIALGIKSETEPMHELGIAILVHKWAEALTLVAF